MLDIPHVRVIPVVEAVHLVSVWDRPPWRMWTNSYTVVGQDGITLIDCGRSSRLDFIRTAIEQLGFGLKDVVSLIATHDHSDHIGCAAHLPTATLRFISGADLQDLSNDSAPLFIPLTGENGHAGDFEYVNLGWHTPGSLAVLHHPSGVLFVDDYIGFYNDPEEGPVGKGRSLRDRACSAVTQWAANEEHRKTYKLDLWVKGLLKLTGFSPAALCPGHGGVLVGDISAFFCSLIRCAGYTP